MNKVIIILVVLFAVGFADPPSSGTKDGAKKETVKYGVLSPQFEKAAAEKKDTIWIVVSAVDTEPKEYSIISPGNEEYTVTRKTGEVVTHGVPPMKVICTGENIKFILSPKSVGATGFFRDVQDKSLIWNAKVPKSQQVEINTSDWKTGKYYGGISGYGFGIIKE